jgi:predicted nucleic acid-binding protein
VGHAIRLALNTGRPAYDAFYVTLAVITGLNLLTADERLVNALGSRFPVIWLGRLGTAGANLYN